MWGKVQKSAVFKYFSLIFNRFLIFRPTSYAVIQAELDCSEYVDGFEYIYNLMADPYCVLVPTSSQFNTFEELISWARQGNLITLSETNYGTKYIDAVQVFGTLDGVEFKAISYESAKNNFAALLWGTDSCICR